MLPKLWLTPICALLLGSSLANARPAHKKALADFFGPFLARKLNDCRTCHLPDKPGQAEAEATDKPHNAFGARLKAVKAELRRAGKNTEIAARLEAIADEDSDGDGVSNLVELLTGHYPGDPLDKPTAAELAGAAQLVASFRKAQQGYRWRPFEPVHRPPLPTVKNPAWVRTPIDAFLAAKYEEHGLQPRPEAAPQVLLRRLYLDLIGLPPTRDELHRFLADPAPDAYEKVVDRLLASPQYGERWGRHWMDVWRYSDWSGFETTEVRDSQPHIWHWRDWIIDALNRDKGYDRMVQEMLAGDQLSDEALPATGFLARHYWRLNRNTWMERTVEHVGKAFLGVTLNCARCHDHAFDPILQNEFYAFRAIFEPYEVAQMPLPGRLETRDANLPDTLRYRDALVYAYDKDVKAQTFKFIRGDERRPDKSTAIYPGVPASLVGPTFKVSNAPSEADLLRYAREAVDQVVVRAQAGVDGARARLSQAQTLADASAELRLAILDLELAETHRDAFTATVAAEAKPKEPRARDHAAVHAVLAQRRHALVEAQRQRLLAELAVSQAQARLNQATKTAALPAADQKQKAAAEESAKKLAAEKTKLATADQSVSKAAQELQSPASSNFKPGYARILPPGSSGRRLALAQWITDRQNPLAARVAMNHIWLRHFGRALVPSVFDFGRNGQQPSHPALLDWLAAEFMAQDWSMKAMHRQIVTSSAYRMESTVSPENVARDPDNIYLWRMNARRMEAEVVRDSVLFAAGQMDPVFGGPDLDHNLGLTLPRRSLYFRHTTEKQMEFLALFNGASVEECYQRTESIVPQQALSLANSSLVRSQARLLARRLSKENGDAGSANAETFVTAAFETVLGRRPTPSELARCQSFLTEQAQRLAQPGRLSPWNGPSGGIAPAHDPALRAREDLVHVLFNHNDFITIR